MDQNQNNDQSGSFFSGFTGIALGINVVLAIGYFGDYIPQTYVVIISAIVFLLAIVLNILPKKQVPKQAEVKKQKKLDVEPLIPIQIYYGSQQGMAAKLAKILADEGSEFGFITNDVDLNVVDFEQEMINNKVGIFCMATHGEGDPTDNAKKFASWLEEPQKCLKGFRFTVFGLGNTQYEHFNKMGRTTNKRLEEQQGVRVYKYGEGDDNASLEEDFNTWKEGLWQELKVTLKDLIEQSKNSNSINQEEQEQILQQITHHGPTYKLELVQEEEINFNQVSGGTYDFQTKQFLHAKDCQIISINELRQNNDEGSTLHIIIDTGSSGLQYKTSMNMGVFPQNSIKKVREVAQYLGEDLNSVYNLQEAKQQKRPKVPFPSPIKVQTILQQFCDFSGQIMKKTLKDLAQLTDNQEFKEKLEFLASHEGKEQYGEQIERNKKTILDILHDYQIKLNLAQFIELCPRISPRLFTIASSNLKYPDQIHIADSLLTDKLPNGQIKVGLCSQYFLDIWEQIKQGNQCTVRVDFRESSFKLPEDQTKSILMIGPGTGIAPFIGFLQEREIFLQNNQQKSNRYILYFGCRKSNSDFIYKKEIEQYEKSQIIDELHIAFSREQQEKVYVQDLLKKQGQQIKQLIEDKKVVIYVCGSTSMGKSVLLALTEILCLDDQRNHQDAWQIIQQMEKDKSIIKELW